MADEKILTRIQNLLAKANCEGVTEAEAEAFMGKAQAMMTEHRLTQQQIVMHGQPIKRTFGGQKHTDGARLPMEAKFLFGILQKFYNVKIILSKSGRKKTEERQSSVIFFGTPEDVEVAMYIYSHLKGTFRNLWYSYKTRTNASTSSRQSFFMGLSQGFTAKMQSEQTKVENQMGLVLVTDKDLLEAYKRQNPNLQVVKQTIHDRDSVARHAGYEQGKNITVANGITAGAGNSRLMLG